MFKFIDENKIEKFKNGFVVLDGRIYTNPTEETLKKVGYKPLVEAEMPEYDVEKQYLVKKYEDGEDSITERYEVCDIEEVPENERDIDLS